MSLILGINWLALCFSFFVVGCMLGAALSPRVRTAVREVVAKVGKRRDLLLARVSINPLIRPGAHPWTAEAVMNPAALRLGGRTHLVYRAIGSDGVSRLGYASSGNGFTFDEILPYPAYVASDSLHLPKYGRRYAPRMYPSGGSWGGCEDPRMVSLDGRVYVTFNMFDDWKLRVAAISMSEEDFLAKRFYKWEGPLILSGGGRHKNWVLFPEMIDGKFAVLHSIIGDTPEQVRVEYVDELADLAERSFESPDPQQIPDAKVAWHVHTRSAGPPPLKTDKGWLVLYHANDGEWQRYKLGAMLLDLEDPSRVLYRSAEPILEPDARYENDGKPGIVYACGATIEGGMLHVYYGGADKVVCVAFAPLAPFLDALVSGEAAELQSKPAQTA